jgi:hypothetical protein
VELEDLREILVVIINPMKLVVVAEQHSAATPVHHHQLRQETVEQVLSLHPPSLPYLQ